MIEDVLHVLVELGVGRGHPLSEPAGLFVEFPRVEIAADFLFDTGA